MNDILPVIEAHRFAAKDFVGGDAALDFVNTMTGRDVRPRDWLDGYRVAAISEALAVMK